MPGGVMEPLQPPQRDKIARRLPDLPLDELDAIGGMYRIERDHDAEPASDVKTRLSAINAKCVALELALHVSEEVGDALSEASHECGRRYDFWRQAQLEVQRLAQIARVAHNTVELREGRPSNARKALVLRLASVLEASGREVGERPNGDLCFLTAEVLQSYGETVASARSIVRGALAKTPRAKG